MKKLILALALVALTVSCKRTNEEMGKIDAPIDSTAVAKDSVKADTTVVDTTAVVKDSVK